MVFVFKYLNVRFVLKGIWNLNFNSDKRFIGNRTNLCIRLYVDKVKCIVWATKERDTTICTKTLHDDADG